MLVRVRVGDRCEDPLTRMTARQTEDALNQANGANAAPGERRISPFLEAWSDPLALADKPIHVRLLARRRVAFASAWRKDAVGHPPMDRDEGVVLEDADEMRVPVDADLLPEQRER